MSITVTKPFLPPISEYQHYLEAIWHREWLTNHGPLVSKLEIDLRAKLGVSGLLYVTNGTIAIQLAIKALAMHGEIITTPFSYVATTSAISWEGCTPVMADIDAETLNIDPNSIERRITENTSGILATHVYGNPCDVEQIERIAHKHNLKVIYDGAHAFGTKYKGKSVYRFGDVSTASFHATKLFHTVEGGAVMSNDHRLITRLGEMRNFGHISTTEFGQIGINGKNSEMHAAMGLCNLKYLPDILARRRQLSDLYDSLLSGLALTRPKITDQTDYNHAYYAVLFETEEVLKSVVERLALHGIFPRRYFYPALAELPYVNQRDHSPVAVDVAKRILCLPLFHTLSEEEVELISRIISEVMQG